MVVLASVALAHFTLDEIAPNEIDCEDTEESFYNNYS